MTYRERRSARQGPEEGRSRQGPVTPGDGCRRALRDRFLRRVFSNPDGRFILKGGSGLLARIPDGRVTRDIDFATASVFDSVQFTGWGCGGNPGPKEDQDFHRSPNPKIRLD